MNLISKKLNALSVYYMFLSANNGYFIVGHSVGKSFSQFANSTKSLKEPREELGAVYLVTESVQQLDNKIHVSAQLIDSRKGNTIWAQDYSGKIRRFLISKQDLPLKLSQHFKQK